MPIGRWYVPRSICEHAPNIAICSLCTLKILKYRNLFGYVRKILFLCRISSPITLLYAQPLFHHFLINTPPRV